MKRLSSPNRGALNFAPMDSGTRYLLRQSGGVVAAERETMGTVSENFLSAVYLAGPVKRFEKATGRDKINCPPSPLGSFDDNQQVCISLKGLKRQSLERIRRND
jgi:hypothetical protein